MLTVSHDLVGQPIVIVTGKYTHDKANLIKSIIAKICSSYEKHTLVTFAALKSQQACLAKDPTSGKEFDDSLEALVIELHASVFQQESEAEVSRKRAELEEFFSVAHPPDRATYLRGVNSEIPEKAAHAIAATPRVYFMQVLVVRARQSSYVNSFFAFCLQLAKGESGLFRLVLHVSERVFV